MDRRAALLFVSVLLVSAGCLGTADETETPPYGENATVAEIVEGHNEKEVQGYRYTLSFRDAKTGELRSESIVRIDHADGKMLVEENSIDDSSATYINLSSGMRYDRELDRPEKVDADKMVERHSITGILSPSPNETRLTLEETDDEGVFRYSADSVMVRGNEMTNLSVSLTAEGFINGISATGGGLESTAEVEKRGDIDVETPDWVDTEKIPRSFGEVAVEQKPGKKIRFVIIDPGQLDKVRLEGPGGASVSHGDLVQAGIVLRVRDGGFSKEEVSGGFVTPNDDECTIQHGRSEVAGQTVNLADIPCDGSGIEGLNGDDIRYETGAEYRIVGVVDGEEALIKSVSTQDE